MVLSLEQFTEMDTSIKDIDLKRISHFHHLLVSNRPFYRYSGHIEFIKSEEYYGMPRVHSVSIYERFLDKKAIIIASKHGTMTFLSITIIY